MDFKNIIEAAKTARNFFEEASKDSKFNECVIDKFPMGCCGKASQILGAYLKVAAPKECFVYVCKLDNDNKSHGWIEHNDYVIDITADQFADFFEPVVVTKNRTWYDKKFIHEFVRREFTLDECKLFPYNFMYRKLVEFEKAHRSMECGTENG